MNNKSLLIRTTLGGALIAAAVLLPEVYQAAGETVPDWMFNLSRLLIFGVILIGLPAWLVLSLIPVVSFLRSYRYLWPMHRKDAPDPNQWLLDIAREDANDPARHLIIRRQTFINCEFSPEKYRPWIELGLTIYNGGVHDILVGPAEGHGIYKGNELPDKIESDGGSRKPRGHEHVFKMKQYILPEIAKEIHQERMGTGTIRSVSLSAVRLTVTSEGPNGRTIQIQLGHSDTFLAPE